VPLFHGFFFPESGHKGLLRNKAGGPTLLRWVFIAAWLSINIFFALAWKRLFKEPLSIAPILADVAAKPASLRNLLQVSLRQDGQWPH